MDVVEAKASFSSGSLVDQADNVLEFNKGDLFEVLDSEGEGRAWWAVRAFKDNAIGFIPAKYVKKKMPINLSQTETTSRNRELHMQALLEMQQRANFKHPDKSYPNVIPDPDYSDSEGELDQSKSQDLKPTMNGHLTDDGIIVPRKLSNPCVESKDRQNLHKELLFNQKIGKNVLNQKSELQKAMDKFQEDQKKKEYAQEEYTKRTSLEKKLEEQANKLKVQEEEEEKNEEGNASQQSEFLRVHAKVRARMDCQ